MKDKMVLLFLAIFWGMGFATYYGYKELGGAGIWLPTIGIILGLAIAKYKNKENEE